MSKSGVSSSTSRVSIPISMKKTIQNIKEIAKNHSEDDIYAMLKECSMDPNETVQRLIHLDTFHQVKSKRGKRNEVMKSRPGEDSRWKHGHQGRGTRGPRGNASSQYSSSDAGGRRNNFTRKENGVQEIREKGFRNPPAPILKEIDTVQPLHVENTLSTPINGPVKMPNGNLGSEHDSKPYQIDTYCSKESTGAGSDSLSTIRPKASAGHAPSASDTVLIPSGDSRILTAVGSIQREVRIEQISNEASAHFPVDNGLGKTESTSNSHQDQSDPQNVEGPPASSSMVKKEASKSANVANSISTVKPFPLQGVGPGVDEATSKLSKLKFSDGQHVIIPDHIQVSDAVKNMLSFGSIDANFGVSGSHAKNENIRNSHSAGDVSPDKATEISSSCVIDAVSMTMQAENTDNQQLQSHLPDENHPSDTQVSFSATNDDQPKEDNLPAMGPPFPYLQTSPSYSFGFMPPMLAHPLVQPEGSESQSHVSSSPTGGSPAVSGPSFTQPLTHPAGVGQASIAVSPQPIPLTHQPYPPNYVPYGHYLSPFYVHPTMHQYYGHTAFPPPLPTSNVFLPPPTVAAAMKTSANYKPRANAGNQMPTGVPSGYGVYSSSQAGYGQNAALTSGKPSTSVDLMPSASKDNYIYSGHQSEGSAVWLPATGRDAASFPLNSFLNFPPQGHHVISPQSSHGPFAVYHTLQPMPTPAPGLPLLQQSQPVTGPLESAGPPSNAYQPQINWNM